MARSQIVATISTRDGVALATQTTGVPADGHYVLNSGKTKLLIENSNGSATAHTVTFQFFRKVDGAVVTARAEAIPAGDTQIFGPFPTDDYGSQLLIDVDDAELLLRAIE